LASHPVLLDEVIERVLHFDMQALGQFFGEIALGECCTQASAVVSGVP
jgi:hypothetical protein